MMTQPHPGLDDLRALRLPELQARFVEIVGEETRCPNKTYLLRRIGEALEARAALATPVENVIASATTPIDDARTEQDGARLQDLDVEQLRARYLDVVGRGTGSHDKRYLIWKIRQA